MKIARGVQTTALKVVVYGPEGIGKSTFLSQFPDVVFIDTEGSTKFLDVARVEPPSSWKMLMEQVSWFRDHPEQLGTLAIDTLDWAEKLCVESVRAKKNVENIGDIAYGQGYAHVYAEFGKLLNLLEELVKKGVNVALSAHAFITRFDQPDEMTSYDRWTLKLIDSKKCSISAMVKEWSDLLLFANYETFAVKANEKDKTAKAQGGKRVMYTTHHPCWDAKNRFGLPDKLVFDFGQIAHCIPSRSAPSGGTPHQSPAATASPQGEASLERVGDLSGGQKSAPSATAPVAYAGPDVPPALAQLMEQSRVTEGEVRQVIGSTGYYPADTPWSTLQKEDFVDGYIIPQWEYFVTTIEADPDWLPF